MAKNRKRKQSPSADTVIVDCPIEVLVSDGQAGELGMMIAACAVCHYRGENAPGPKLIRTVTAEMVTPAVREEVAAWLTTQAPGMSHDESYELLWERG
jgi:hypothetical protein